MSQAQKLTGWVLLLLLSACAGGCKVYDESLVGQTYGYGRGVAVDADAGRGGQGQGLAGAAGAAGPGARPTDAAGADDTDAGASLASDCGDGIVEPGEHCDVGIPPGAPGACPSACSSSDPCWHAERTGSDCRAECTLVAADCGAQDGCCSAQCSSDTDPDCSAHCGDGVIQPELGETCDGNQDSEFAPACPTAQDCDDADPCTRDALAGSADNCTAACTHTPIDTPQSGDGCCPSGANANSDDDCSPQCGNGVREGSEECDGSQNCDPTCKLDLTDTQRQCLAQLDDTACLDCECTHCADEAQACYFSGDSGRDQACTAVETCATEHHCAGRDCYCGSQQSDLECVLFPSGPCRDVIEAAAGSSLSLVVTQQLDDPQSALGRAQTVGSCRRANCSSECP